MSFLLQNTARCCLNTLQLNLSRVNILIPKRDKGAYKRKFPNPVWLQRKVRTIHDDLTTVENQTFVKEILTDKYGPPSLIKGVQTFANCVPAGPNTEIKSSEWRERARRCGVIARKIGVYPLWKKDGSRIMTTMLQVVDNHVIKYTPADQYQPAKTPVIKPKNKLGCLLVGAESTDPTYLTKEYCGIFTDSGVMPKKFLQRFYVGGEGYIPPGTPINASHFRVGDYVDVLGKTIDRGFQGVMKRWGFHGGPATHGVTKNHRRGGNIGANDKVWKGTKMPGFMGDRFRVQRGLKIWRMNTKYNVLWVSGLAVPGETNSVVAIYDTILPLRRLKTAPPFPTSTVEYHESLPEDIWSEDLHNFKDPTIIYKPE